jgi:hypothetical protein
MSERSKRLAILEILGLSGAVVGALALYLTAIAAKLGSVSHVLGKVTAGVRAIERQTEPLGPTLKSISGNLEETAEAVKKLKP